MDSLRERWREETEAFIVDHQRGSKVEIDCDSPIGYMKREIANHDHCRVHAGAGVHAGADGKHLITRGTFRTLDLVWHLCEEPTGETVRHTLRRSPAAKELVRIALTTGKGVPKNHVLWVELSMDLEES